MNMSQPECVNDINREVCLVGRKPHIFDHYVICHFHCDCISCHCDTMKHMYRISEELEMEEISNQDGVLPLEMLLEFMVSEKNKSNLPNVNKISLIKHYQVVTNGKISINPFLFLMQIDAHGWLFTFYWSINSGSKEFEFKKWNETQHWQRKIGYISWIPYYEYQHKQEFRFTIYIYRMM